MNEKEVVHIWQQQLIYKTGLATEDGQPLEIVYPGRPNDDRGADFRDAVILLNGTITRGDVEIHVAKSDWHTHGHDRDPAYNRVVLHVVMRHDSQSKTVLENGTSVPVLALEKFLQQASPGPPCAAAAPAFAASVLDKAGDSRFRTKATRFGEKMRQNLPSQVLYEGIMEALGYAKNKAPFLELARIVPLKALEKMAKGRASDAELINLLQKFLLKKAEQIGGWNTYKLRPANSPVRRILAMSRLLVRFRHDGISRSLHDEVTKTQITKRGINFNGMQKALVVNAGSREGSSFTLLGTERAGEITVNVVLPFYYALGKDTGRAGLTRKALSLYRGHPGLAGNSVVNHMGNQLQLGRKEKKSARRQQGLLHIYKELCVQGRCSACPLSQFQARIGVQV